MPPLVTDERNDDVSKVLARAVVELDEQEERWLVEYEEGFERCRTAFLKGFGYLLLINEKRLYRKTHETFEGYCHERWEISRQYAYRLIDAARVARNLEMSPIGDKLESESQARPLARLDPPQQQAAWQEAVASAGGGQPTAKQVAAAAEKVAPKPPRQQAPSGFQRVPGTPISREDPSSPDFDEPANVQAEVPISTSPPPPRKARPRDEEWEECETEGTDEPSEPQAELTDAEYLIRLPAHPHLSGEARDWFDSEALLFRWLSALRRQYADDSRSLVKKATKMARGHQGPLVRLHYRYLGMNDPSRWEACGDCRGTGKDSLLGKCTPCHGHGYTLGPRDNA